MKFRALTANEIECRVQTVKQKGLSLLLYKDARCDMSILDECVGALNWKRELTRENRNCIVSIWDSEKSQWVSKEDTGTESNTEQQKGLASDSFKRACFNWGIGRELYTSPFIWINDTNAQYIKPKGQGFTCYERFTVEKVAVEDGVITGLAIKDSKGKRVFVWQKEK